MPQAAIPIASSVAAAATGTLLGKALGKGKYKKGKAPPPSAEEQALLDLLVEQTIGDIIARRLGATHVANYRGERVYLVPEGTEDPTKGGMFHVFNSQGRLIGTYWPPGRTWKGKPVEGNVLYAPTGFRKLDQGEFTKLFKDVRPVQAEVPLEKASKRYWETIREVEELTRRLPKLTEERLSPYLSEYQRYQKAMEALSGVRGPTISFGGVPMGTYVPVRAIQGMMSPLAGAMEALGQRVGLERAMLAPYYTQPEALLRIGTLPYYDLSKLAQSMWQTMGGWRHQLAVPPHYEPGWGERFVSIFAPLAGNFARGYGQSQELAALLGNLGGSEVSGATGASGEWSPYPWIFAEQGNIMG